MDTSGRLTLFEMRNEVRRRCDLLRYNINVIPGSPSAGEEVGLQQIDRLVSNEDLNMYLNMALARRCVEVNVGDNTIMADEAVVDVVADQVEYILPEDMMFLRAVYWKPVGVTNSLAPPSQRYMLFEEDSDNDIALQPSADTMTTYRRRLNMIVLNQVPERDNPGGLLIDYVKAMLPLLDDLQVIEIPLAQIMQYVIIQDSVVEVTAQKLKLDTTELRQTQAELVAQLQLAVVNYHAPKTIRMVSNVVLAYPPFSRRPNSWQSWGFGTKGWW